MTVTTSPGGSNALRPVVLHSVGFRRRMRKKKVNARSFFSTQQCLCQRFSAGSNEVRAPKECVSGNKHQQIPSNPDSLSYTHTHTYAHSAPLHLSRDQTRGLGKRWPPFGPLSCPLHPAQGGDGRKLVPPSTPTLLPWRASQFASINHF